MAVQLLAIPALAKAVAFAKGLAGAKGATTILAGGKIAPMLAAKASGLASGQAARQAITRMAGPKLANFGGSLLSNAGAALPQSGKELGQRAALDLLFGGIQGAMTPGDLGDKLIAGGTATLGGIVGSSALRAGTNAIRPGMVIPGAKNYSGTMDMLTEAIGGFGGDFAAQGVADSLLRLKGGGTTPYEKMAAEQQRELEQQILRQYLSGKGGYPSADPTLVSNGLG